MFKQKWVYWSLVCLLLFCGCNDSKKIEKGVVRFNLGAEPHTLDPRRTRDPNAQMLMRACFEGLTRIDANNEPQLALASQIDLAEDLKTYVITLRDSFWSNGDPIRMSDFAYAWKSLLSSDFPSDNAYQLYVIKNAKAFKEKKCGEEDLGIQLIDERTLVLELEYPVPYFLELLACPFFFPVHERIDRQNSRWAERQETFISNGPFRLNSWHHHDQISVRKNPNYWDVGNVRLAGVDFFMVENVTGLYLFEKGELHWEGSPILSIPVDALVRLRDWDTLYTQPRDETAFLRLNIEEKVLRSPKMRKALALAIDRQQIIDHILQANQIPATSLVPPSMSLSSVPYFEAYAPKKAKAFFAEALREQSLEICDCSALRLTYNHSERSHLVAQAIQQQWNEAFGFQIELEPIERGVFFDRISHRDYQIAYSSWGADFHDPINFLEVFKYRYQSTNNTNWENEQYIELLNQSNQIGKQQERFLRLKESEKVLMEEMPIIPLYHYTMQYLKNEKLQGMVLTYSGILDFKWAYLTE